MATIREDEFDRIAAIYERQADACVRGVALFYGEIADLSRKTCYAPLVNFTNQICLFYQGDLQDHLLREFNRWYDSPYSLHALTRSIAAGDAAERRARAHMDDIGAALRQMFRRGPEPISVDTSAPRIQDGDFRAFQDAITGCTRRMESACQDALGEIRGMADGNDAVNCITGFVQTTGASLTESFRGLLRSVEDGLGYFQKGVQGTLNSVPAAGQSADAHLPWDAGIPFL